MSNDFDDDFDSGYIDDDENFYNNEESAARAGGQPFLIALIALIGIFIISALCIFVVYNARRSGNEQDLAVQAIEATNAAIQQTNIAVTVAIEATETARVELASQPTFTPENTPTPETPPTETPVVDQASPTPGEGTAVAGEGDETAVSGTDAEGDGEGEEDGENGETDGTVEAGSGVIIVGGTSTPTPTPISAADAGKDNTLPETGLEVWVVALIGLVLIAVLFGARRLRTG